MATKKETRVTEIIIEGKKAEASFKDMRASLAVLNAQLDKLPANSAEFVAKSKELKEVKSRFTDLTKEAKGLEKAQASITDQFLDFVPFGNTLKGLKDKFNSVTGGVGGAIKSMNSLKGAIIGTGIGALVILLGSLINYLTSTQGGIDKVTAVTRPLNAIFQKLIGVVQELGGSVFKGLAMILNGDIKAGLEVLGSGVKDALSGTVEAIEQGYEAGTKLDQLTKQIERTEIDLTKRRAEMKRDYKLAMETAEDLSSSEEARRAAAQKGIDIQNQLLDMEQALLDKKIERMELDQSLNDTSREQEKELAELYAQRIEFETAAAESRATARSKLNTVNQQIAGEEKKRHEEAKKREEEYRKHVLAEREKLAKASEKFEADLYNLRLSLMDEGLEKELTKLGAAHAQKMAELDRQKDEILMNETIKEEEKLSILAQYRQTQDLLDQEYKAAKEAAELEEREVKLEAELERLENEETVKNELIEQQYLQALTSKAQRDQALLDLERATLEQRLALLQEAGKGQTAEALRIGTQLLAIEAEKNAKIIEEEQKREAKKKELQQTGLDIARDFVNFHTEVIKSETNQRTAALDKRIQILSKDEESQIRNKNLIAQLEYEKAQIQREANIRLKKIERGKIIASGIAEVANIWKGAAALGFPVGPIVGALQTALAVGRTVLALRNLQSVTFAGGGFTGPGLSVNGSGRLIDQTGHTVAGVVHDNEYVVPKFMTTDPKYANVLGWLESERTRRFATGGPTSTVPTPAQGRGDQTQAMAAKMDMLIMTFENYAARVDQWPRALKVNNDPRDISEGIRVTNEVDADSDIR